MGRLTETVKILIILNVLFFGAKLFNPEFMDRMFSLYYFENPNFNVWQPVTHMFMHGDIMHILFNMFGLYMFGSPLEKVWGRNKFIFFYFSAGLGAALIHSLVGYFHVHQGIDVLLSLGESKLTIMEMLSNTTGEGSYRAIEAVGLDVESFFSSWNVPALGASGAVYGVLVAFGLMYPNTGLMLIFFPVPIKAKYFIPGILIMDIVGGLTGNSILGQNIAHWAHIGGALFGFIMAYYWKKNSMDNTRWD